MYKNKNVVRYWSVLLLSLIVSFILLIALYFIHEKAKSLTNKFNEIVSLGRVPENTSDYLTSQARAFSVTGDPVYLKNFWYKVNIEKRRDFVVSRVAYLALSSNELASLEKSKEYSDRLIRTEK